jgi:hypothetical protein
LFSFSSEGNASGKGAILANETKTPIQAAKPALATLAAAKPIKPEEPRFIRQRRKRRVAWIVLGISFVGVLTMAIVAFLGQNFGRFTIRLDNGNDSTLTMAQNLNAGNITNGTTYLDVNGFMTDSLTQADDLPSLEELDADVTDTTLAAKQAVENDTTKYYFVYTFYLKNLGTATVPYEDYMNVASVTEPANVDESCSIESILRIRVFENLVVDGQDATHNMTTYAKKRTIPKETTSDWEPDEYISKSNATETYNQGYATSFSTDDGDPSKIMIFDENQKLETEQIYRYTVVMWLEGNDPDCNDVKQPQGGTVTLAMHFLAQ